jgi:hypothetical protein
MRFKSHIKLLGIVTLAWILFLIGGLPYYYQQYSTNTMIVFDIIILPPIWYIVYRSAKKVKPGRGFVISLWWSFYISVPLFIYDLIYCGIYLDYGVGFLWQYWYITVYYIIPWIFFPLTGFIIDKIEIDNV